MPQWIDVLPVADLPQGAKQCVSVEGRSLVVFHVVDAYHAIENSCPHAGLPLGEGELHGKVLTCPFHGYAYRVDTGRNIDFPDHESPVRTFAVRVEDETLQVDLETS